MNSLVAATSKAESTLEAIATPMKPYFPALARFLMVVTFLEDSLRIMSQWEDQVNYLERHQGFPQILAKLFLLLNVLVMIVCSILAISRKKTEIACAGLGMVLLSQWVGYGLLLNFNFLLRNLSVVGGLLMLLADAYASKRKKLFAGLPSLNESDKSNYLQLFGRILLVFLFLTFVFSGEFSMIRMFVSAIGLFGCVLVVIGFKAKYTAWFLIALLCVSNVILNNWWTLHHSHPKRDFLKYDFFQNLSIMGGFLLLANMGAGGISVDEKKKNF